MTLQGNDDILTCTVCPQGCLFSGLYLMNQFRFKDKRCLERMEKFRMSVTTDCPPFEVKSEALSASPKEMEAKGTALRFNEGKVPMAYVPLDLLDGAARVMEKGAVKYGDPENYRKGYPELRSPLSSLMRHLTELQRAIAEEDLDGSGGHLLDKESGEGHIHHLITSALLLLHSMRLKGYKT
jgi:hypothetical protein